MKNETKLTKVYEWLKGNGYNPHICKKYKKKKSADFTALAFKVGDYHDVEIKIESGNDKEWYEAHKRYNPIFIRKGESPKFVISKVQDVIIKVMTKTQAYLMLTPAQREQKKKRHIKHLQRLERKRAEKMGKNYLMALKNSSKK